MEMKSEDLGNGFTLMFQRTASDPTQVRAVVKSSTGEIVNRGPVVPESQINRSRFMAVSEWMEANLKVPEPPVEEESDNDEEDDFDEEDELL